MYSHHRIEKQKHRRLKWIGQWWLHFAGHRCISVEWSALSTSCHLSFAVGHGDSNDGWQFSIAIPPIALYVGVDGFNLPAPRRMIKATWDDNREVSIRDEYEFNLAIHSWAIWFTPWGKWGEWCAADPWWMRGVNFNIQDFFCGRAKCTVTEGQSFDVIVPMPERSYRGKATIKYYKWTRPRWFSRYRNDVSVDMQEGIPFPGKGENSWDCGMDALWGFGLAYREGMDVPTAGAGKGMESAMESRRRYGGSPYWLPPVESEVKS